MPWRSSIAGPATSSSGTVPGFIESRGPRGEGLPSHRMRPELTGPKWVDEQLWFLRFAKVPACGNLHCCGMAAPAPVPKTGPN